MLPPIAWQLTPYQPLGVATVVVSTVVTVYAWRHRDVPEATPLAVLMTGVTVWTVGVFLVGASRNIEAKVLFTRLLYLGIVVVPVGWAWFAAAYTSLDHVVTRRVLLALSMPSAVTTVVSVTPLYDPLLYTDMQTETITALGSSFTYLKTVHGWWFWAWVGWAYLLVAVGTALLLWSAYRAGHVYRGQAAMLLGAAVVALGANALTITDLSPLGLDVTPFGFVASGLLLAVATFRHRLLTVSPVERDLGRDEVIASMDDAVVIVDEQRRILDLNPSAESIAGVAASDAVGRSLDGVMPSLAERLAANGADGERIEVELVVDGDPRDYDIQTSRLSPGGDLVSGTVVTMRDITERKERRRELERYSRILNTVGDVVFAVDDEGYILGVNDAAVEMSGYDRDELVGMWAGRLMDEDARERAVELLRELLADPEREDTTFEMDLLTADGDRIRCENHMGILTDEAGEYRGSVGILRDITRQRRRSQQLNVLHRVLRHDLRNDMNVVLGNAQLIQDGHGDPGSYAEDIKVKAEKLLELGDKVRRIESVLDAPDSETPLDVATLVENRVRSLAETYPAATVRADVPEEAWAHASDLVGLALDNLLENAVEHTGPDPTVEVTLSTDDDYVSVAVADDGPGIPEAEREILLRGRETQLEHASGIGLWIVHWIVTEAGGEVTFAENDPQGSVVELRLPAADHDRERAGRSPGMETTPEE